MAQSGIGGGGGGGGSGASSPAAGGGGGIFGGLSPMHAGRTPPAFGGGGGGLAALEREYMNTLNDLNWAEHRIRVLEVCFSISLNRDVPLTLPVGLAPYQQGPNQGRILFSSGRQ